MHMRTTKAESVLDRYSISGGSANDKVLGKHAWRAQCCSRCYVGSELGYPQVIMLEQWNARFMVSRSAVLNLWQFELIRTELY